jgi:hypothetical protein
MDRDKHRDELLYELIEKAKGSETHFAAVVTQDHKDTERAGPPDSILLSQWLENQLSLRGRIAKEVESLADVTSWTDVNPECNDETVDSIMALIQEAYSDD